jgi:hypothetical protein
MNSCCALPVDTIARNEHLANGECCLVADLAQIPAAARCPVSQTVGRKVQRRTLENLLKPYARALLESVQYYYCPDPNCPIVYFSNVDVRTFSVGELTVAVFDKDKSENTPVCYCFDWTRKKIKDQIAEAGKSTTAVEIAKKVKAAECACDIKNPKGRCCLGDVNAFVKESLRNAGTGVS